MSKKPYSIGIDIGTGSVGWAVIDKSCELVRYKHQNMSGSHLFASAETAEKRRMFRSNRRRMNRRKQRILQLQMLFDPLVSQRDPAFFIRLKEAMLKSDDKEFSKSSNILFNDKGFTDADYRKKFPTIYHLRKTLVESSEKQDIRLIYLALHHMIKYRGHFLYEGQTLAPGDIDDVAVRENLLQLDEFFGGYNFEENADAIIEMISRNDITASSKAKQISEFFAEHEKAKQIKEYVKLIVGNKAQSSVICGDEAGDLSKSFAFSDTNYEDETQAKLEVILGDDFAGIITAEAIYKWSLLQSVLKSRRYISQAMVDSYDEYAIDLQALKSLFKQFAPDEYSSFFRKSHDTKVVCYSNYEDRGSVKIDDIIKHIKKLFESNGAAKSSLEYQRFEQRASLGKFLRKQRIRENGAIPNQIHGNEMAAIIENQKQHYPELGELRDKLMSILTFRIPYHVGPLKTGGEFAWAIKNQDSDQKIYPWNFNETIDVDASAEKFIERMRNFCTYLPSETVLPKFSLLYAEFELRNELKSVRVDEKLLGRDVQNELVNRLFSQQKSVTTASLKKWLIAQGFYDKIEAVTGTQQETKFASSLTAQIDFSAMGFSVDSDRKIIEQIIEWVTLFEDKKVLKSRLEKLGDKITDDQKVACLKLRYTGWGRLSRKLLDGVREDCGLFGSCSVMDVMRRDGCAHFMKIIDSDEYPFKKRIADLQSEAWGDRTTITYDDVKNLAGSPAIKRGIWRSVKIVNEIVEIMGYAPETINIEMARNEDEKKRTTSRQRKLLRQYETLITLADEYNRQRARELKKELTKTDEKRLSSRRLFLYFSQNGKCAYSGDSLCIGRLSDYDIDHVIPRALLKDDSINNTVLVKQGYNREKSSEYPLKSEIIQKMTPQWEMWKKAKMMDEVKFRRLTRVCDLSAEDVAGFINRQIVETRQISKHVARMLGEQFRDSDTKIRTIRAGLSSEYRRVFDLPKIRELNDFHHAKDAYLAAVIGEFLSHRFPGLDKGSFYNEYQRYQKTRTSKLNPFFVIAEMQKDAIDTKTGEYVWTADEANRLIERIMGYNDVLVTKMVETSDGEFYGQNALGKNSATKLIPIKKGLDVRKYGGYSGENGAYSVAVEWRDGKKVKRQLLKLPIRIANQIAGDTQKLREYFASALGEDAQPKIIIPKVPKNQKIMRNGSLQYVVSDKEVHNAVQLTLPLNMQRKLAPALKRGRRVLLDKERIVLDEFFDTYVYKLEKQYPIFDNERARIEKSREAFLALNDAEKNDAVNKFLIMTSQGANNPDLSKPAELKLSKRFGRKTNQPMNIDEIDFIYESITGLRRRVIRGRDL